MNGLPPLAERMRPKNLEDYIGQEHLLSENAPLTRALEAGVIPSMIFWGPPGVGKTTLVNSLDPDLNLRVGEISSAHEQGKHTTTFAEMHQLKSGGFIIDTPGIRAFGLVDLEKNHYAHYFPEMRSLLGECKYHNCLHLEEPDCAIKLAVQDGAIFESRYNTYLQLMNEDKADPYRRSEFK